MLQFEELRGQLLSHKNALDELAEALGLEKMKAEIADLEAQAAQDGFWDDLQKIPDRAQAHEHAEIQSFGL